MRSSPAHLRTAGLTRFPQACLSGAESLVPSLLAQADSSLPFLWHVYTQVSFTPKKAVGVSVEAVVVATSASEFKFTNIINMPVNLWKKFSRFVVYSQYFN